MLVYMYNTSFYILYGWTIVCVVMDYSPYKLRVTCPMLIIVPLDVMFWLEQL